MEKILEKSGNFVSLEKWEPWLVDARPSVREQAVGKTRVY